MAFVLMGFTALSALPPTLAAAAASPRLSTHYNLSLSKVATASNATIGHHSLSLSKVAPSVPKIRFASPHSVRRDVQCPNGQWIGFNNGNTDINAFYGGNTGTGPNGCEVEDNPVAFPTGSPANIPATFSIPASTTAQVNGTITVAATGSLTIPAGDTLIMENNYSIFVQSGGTLNLTGTGTLPAQTVTVKALHNSPGNWGMIDYEVGSAGAIAYSVVNDAGGGENDGNSNYVYTELALEGVSISVTHSQFLNSYGNGIEITQGGNPTLTSDTFTYQTNLGFSSSSGYAVVYDFVPGGLTGSVSGLSSTGYGYNDVEIGNGGPAQSFSGTGTWPQAGIPYRINVDIQVSSGSMLTIASGVTILMDNKSIFAESGSTLNLSGASGSMVTITSANDYLGSPSPDKPGDWGMVDYKDGSAGSVTYTTLRDGGGGATGSANYLYTNLAIEGVRSAVAVTNSTFANSYENGIELTDNAKATILNDTFSYCTSCSFGANSNYAVHYDFVPGNLMSGTGAGATPLISGLTSTGYGYNFVYIPGGSSGLFSTTGTWPNPGIAYLVDNDLHITAGASLTLAAGDTFLVSGDLYADNKGTLAIAGTPSAPVTLTSSKDFALSTNAPSPGDWGGIDYQNGSKGSVAYAIVKYGGAYSQDGYADLVIANPASSLSVTDSSFVYSGGNDVEVVGGAFPHLNRDVFGQVPNSDFGVDNYNYTSGAKVDATRDYWSSVGGPASGTLAPASAGVADVPWYSNSATGTSTAAVPAPKAYGAAGSIGVHGAGGTGGIGVDTFNANPETMSPQGSPQLYFDARTWSSSNFTSVTLKDCDGTSGRSLDFYSGGTWKKLSNVTGPDANGCLSASLTASTTPSVSSLAGNGVAFAAALPIEPTTTKVTSSAANNTSTYGQSFTLTATVQATLGTPTGSVVFESDGTALGAAQTLSAGKASFKVSKISAGTHAITAVYTPASGANFSGSTSSPALTEVVNKATLAVKATNEAATYGGKLPKLAWSANFAGGDTSSSLTKQPTCATAAKTSLGKISSGAGTYTISCSGAVDTNYNISYVSGKLTVKPAGVSVSYAGPTSITSKKSVTLSGFLKTTSGTGISGRKLTFTLGSGGGSQSCTSGKTSSSGKASCTISKVTYKKGQTKVVVKFAGDPSGSSDFFTAGSATKSVTVK